MSQENVELVRRATTAAYRKPKPDFATVNELFHPDHELVSQMSGLEGEIFRGAQGFRKFSTNLTEAWESWKMRVEEVTDITENRVMVATEFSGRSQRGGPLVEQRFWAVLTVENGKVTRTENYASRDQALEAAGLSEQDARGDS